MTAEGLLCRQYLGAKRDNPMLTGGVKYLMDHLPDESLPNIYYWYYATQVMHNMSGYEWDTWNRKLRDLLVRTQVHNVDQCANGSWAPEKDMSGSRGSRVMTTSLATLTLEVVYRRYPPPFRDATTPSDSPGKGSSEIATKPEAGGTQNLEKKEADILRSGSGFNTPRRP